MVGPLRTSGEECQAEVRARERIPRQRGGLGDATRRTMTETQPSLLERDPDLAKLIAAENAKEHASIRLIASENYASRAVMEATGSCLTNKYSEGYPHKRYYEGQAVIDQVEELAIARLTKLFGDSAADKAAADDLHV